MTTTLKHAACTLFEGNHHLGAGALVNSLFRNGFQGTLYAGYRGEPPPWTNSSTLYVGKGCQVKFIKLDTPIHLANFKPAFMRQVLGEEDTLCYFDPDITIKAPWTFFEKWTENGVALVEDGTYPYMPNDHPLRYQWLEVAFAAGLTQKKFLNRYYNSGFIGIQRKFQEILEIWESLLGTPGYNPSAFTARDRTSPWNAADQDLLNVAAMTTDVPLTTLGPDGMDFRPGGYVMSHAVLSPKPWERNYLRAALNGKQPTLADKGFWENAEYPIRLFPETVIRQRNLALKAAIAVGRLWHR